MAEYTEKLRKIASKLEPLNWEQEEYVQKLIDVASTFRPFSDAISLFIQEHGYTGDLGDTECKIAYISEKFEIEEIVFEKRNIKKWFSEGSRIEKETGYLFCFAFHLNVEEANDFFCKVCLLRGIDCHRIDEAVYYYCLKNGLKYQTAQAIISKIKGIEVENDYVDIPYTESILTEIDRMTSMQELIKYLNDNYHAFDINMVTATKDVREIWEDISAENGLANREIEEGLLDPIATEEKERRKKLKTRSFWEIYKQIIGYDNEKIPAIEKNRSIKTFLKDNAVMHKVAEQNFPDKQGLERVMRGKEISPERMRKILIFLLFYRFWVSLALERNSYDREESDAASCISTIDGYLLECGYQELYYGNPYDWIFLFCCFRDVPLSSFRDYMEILKSYT